MLMLMGGHPTPTIITTTIPSATASIVVTAVVVDPASLTVDIALTTTPNTTITIDATEHRKLRRI